MDTLRDSDGDVWEVLPESGYVPQQAENWVRYQDEDMRSEAVARAGALVANGTPSDEAAEAAWSALYAERGHPRVFVREVPHERSTGSSSTRGPRGVYEVIAWLGLGIPGAADPGAMHRALVRPSARWYSEQAAAAALSLAGIDGDDVGAEDAREELRRSYDYNMRAHKIALVATSELTVLEMQQRVLLQPEEA